MAQEKIKVLYFPIKTKQESLISCLLVVALPTQLNPLKIPTGKEANQLAIYKHGWETEFDQIKIQIYTVSASGHDGTQTQTIGLQDNAMTTRPCYLPFKGVLIPAPMEVTLWDTMVVYRLKRFYFAREDLVHCWISCQNHKC